MNKYLDNKINKQYVNIEKLEEEVSMYLWSYEAWSVMLVKKNIIKKEYAKEIFSIFLELEQKKISYDDEQNHRGIESYIINKLGTEKGGNLSVARTTITPYLRMEVRIPLLKLMCTIIELLNNLLYISEKYKEDIMPGYTHLAHAQPTTFGHYLLSVYDPLMRIFKNIESSYDSINMNELGCGALAGTSLKIDRDLPTKLLGFNSLVENANDAVSITDCFVFAISNLSNMMSVVSRFSQDLNYWNTAEFDFLDVPRVMAKPSHSYMMPQKTSKNNGDLEDLRICTANVIGYLVATITNASRTSHADMHEMIYIHHPLLKSISEVDKHLFKLSKNIMGIRTNKEKMLNITREGFSCATELAFDIMRKKELDYRTAHNIVNTFVNYAIEKGQNALNLDTSLLNIASKKIINKELNLSEKDIKKSLDPQNFINKHNSKGGVNPKEVSRMIINRKKDITQIVNYNSLRVKKLLVARKMLKKAMFDYINK
ncbi:MAG TPA: hypothetical protein DC049_07710 [Spirochaetia bacterium]|nr:hypothetical protein [Spirochaetia bacterium]